MGEVKYHSLEFLNYLNQRIDQNNPGVNVLLLVKEEQGKSANLYYM